MAWEQGKAEIQETSGQDTAERSPAPGAVPVLQGSPRLLVVDDDQDLCDLYRVALEQAGCRVGQAFDGEQALEHYQAALRDSDPYRVVLLDINLPGMNGKECLKLMRELDGEARVIITSGDRIQSQDSGMGPLAGVLPKPFRLRTLVYSVASALESSQTSGLDSPAASMA